MEKVQLNLNNKKLNGLEHSKKGKSSTLPSPPLFGYPLDITILTRNEQKFITGTQTIPISKLGGWKYTIDNTDVVEIGQ